MNKVFALAIAAVFAVAGCSSTFLVSKNGQAYFLGADSNAAHRLLCESGDLAKIISETNLPRTAKEDLYRYSCSSERSREKVREIFAALSPEQRKELRTSFKNNGYDINYIHC